MTKAPKTPLIEPSAGYILCQPYLPKNTTFVSGRESSGEDQKSEVLVVGNDVIDNEGNLRASPCQKGDIIIHAQTNKEFELSFTKYRFVHFSEVHGILKI